MSSLTNPNRSEGSVLRLSCYGMAARSLSRCAYLLAGSGGSALDCFRDRRCANRQRDLVVYEGKLMAEYILPDLGIQEALAGNQGINRTKEHPDLFPAQLWGQTLHENPC